MFLTGTLLNVVTGLIGLALGTRMPSPMQSSLTTGLGVFTVLIGPSMGLRVFTDPAARAGDAWRCWQPCCSASRSESCSACTVASSGSAGGSSAG